MDKSIVLVATDLSPKSEYVFLRSYDFSKQFQSDIHLLHVIDKSDAENLNIEDIIEDLSKQISNVGIDNKEVSTDYSIEEGKIVPVILKVEKKLKPKYIFVGVDTDIKASRTTFDLIEESDCPVFVFSQETEKRSFKNIVLPLDLTKETKQKIEATVKIAKLFNSTVHIISATDFSDEMKLDSLKIQMQEVKSIFEDYKINTTIKLLKIPSYKYEIIGESILEFANKIDADLIVIITKQNNKIQKLLTGKTSNNLINKSRCPFLCINPESFDK